MGSAKEVTYRKRLPSTDYCLILLFPWSFTGRFKGRIEFGAANSIGGFPWWPSGKEPACPSKRCKRLRFNPWVRKIPWRRYYIKSMLVAQMVKNLPATQETQVWSLVWEDPLEKEMAISSSILAWEIPWTEEPNGLLSTGSQKSQT